MNITITTELTKKQPVLALAAFEEDGLEDFDKQLRKEIEEAVNDTVLKKEFGEMYSCKVVNNEYKKTLVIFLGKRKELTVEKARRAASMVITFAKTQKSEGVETTLGKYIVEQTELSAQEVGRAIAEGFVLGNYHFSTYLTGERKEKIVDVKNVDLLAKEDDTFKQGVEEGKQIAEATNLARTLVNEPAITATPSYLAKQAERIAEQYNLELEILEKDEMRKRGMGALLGVTVGSDEPPKLIILKYNGAGDNPYTAIVGKGITFDSGGINLKPTGYIEDMKTDMGGGAAVLGTMQALAALGVKKNVLGVVPTCENMINGSATRPGDILKAFNGKTIEVKNTDAEGRLILADALSYTETTHKPETIIDLATLTGACVVALGPHASGLLGNDEKVLKALRKAGNDSYDRVWQLPLYEEHKDNMDGSISDLQNTSNKGRHYGSGTITAAVFLSKFVDKAKWAHLDIAGSSTSEEEKFYIKKGATGSGVRVLMYYFMQ